MSGLDAITACAPPMDCDSSSNSSGSEEEDRVVHRAVSVGTRVRPTSRPSALKVNEMIVVLRPLQLRTKQHPFWLGLVKSCIPEAETAVVQWYGAFDESYSWEFCIWGEALHVLTQEMYDSLPEEHKEKGKYRRANIGKAIEKSVETMNVKEDRVFWSGFKLTQQGKLSATTRKILQQQLLLEQVKYRDA